MLNLERANEAVLKANRSLDDIFNPEFNADGFTKTLSHLLALLEESNINLDSFYIAAFEDLGEAAESAHDNGELEHLDDEITIQWVRDKMAELVRLYSELEEGSEPGQEIHQTFYDVLMGLAVVLESDDVWYEYRHF